LGSDIKKWKKYKRDFSRIESVAKENLLKKEKEPVSIEELLQGNPLQLNLAPKNFESKIAKSVNGTTVYPEYEQSDPKIAPGLQTLVPTSKMVEAKSGIDSMIYPNINLDKDVSFQEFLSRNKRTNRNRQTIDIIDPEVKKQQDERKKQNDAVDWAVKVGLPVPKVIQDYRKQDVHANIKDYANGLLQSFAQTLVIEPLKSIDVWNKNFPMPSLYGLMMGDTKLEDRPFYKTGERLDKGVTEKLPVNPFVEENFDVGLSRGAGSLAAFYLTSLTGNVLGLNSKIMPMLFGSVVQGQSEFNAAYEKTGDEQLAFHIFLANIPVGMTEGLPIGRTLDRINKVSGNGITRLLKGGIEGSFEEGLQEFGQNLASGLVARNTYDDSRDAMDEAITGGLQGMLLGGMANVMGVGVKSGIDKLTGAPQEQETGTDKPVEEIKPSEKIEVEADPESLIMNPIDPKASQEEKVQQLQKLSAENEPVVSEFIKEVDADLGTSSKFSYKDPEKIIEKANRPSIKSQKQWHDVEHVRDSFRFKTVIDNTDQLRDVYDKINEKGLEIVKVDTEKMLTPKEWGWRFVGFDLKMANGQLVEYYLPIKELEAAKKINHKAFELWRNATPEYLKANQVKYAKALQKSNKIYNKAFQKYLKRVNQTEAEFSASFMSLADNLGSLTREKLSLRSSGDGTSLTQESPDLMKNSPSAAENTVNLPDDLSSDANDVSSDVIYKDTEISEENQDTSDPESEYFDAGQFFDRTNVEFSDLWNQVSAKLEDKIKRAENITSRLRADIKNVKGSTKKARETKADLKKQIAALQGEIKQSRSDLDTKAAEFGEEIAGIIWDKAKKRKINIPESDLSMISDDIFDEINNGESVKKINDTVNEHLDRYEQTYGTADQKKKVKKQPKQKIEIGATYQHEFSDDRNGVVTRIESGKVYFEDGGYVNESRFLETWSKVEPAKKPVKKKPGKKVKPEISEETKKDISAAEQKIKEIKEVIHETKVTVRPDDKKQPGYVTDKPLGINEDGNYVWEDQKGVRYYVGKNNIKFTQRVTVIPSKSGVQIATNISDIQPDFLTREELAERNAGKNTKIDQIDKDIEDLGNKLLNLTRGKLSAGIDPEALTISVQLIGKYIEKGYYNFKQMLEDVYRKFGEDNFKVLFNPLKMGYNAYKTSTEDEISSKMDDFGYVKDFDISEITNAAIEKAEKNDDITAQKESKEDVTDTSKLKREDQDNAPGELETGKSEDDSGNAGTGKEGTAGKQKQADPGGDGSGNETNDTERNKRNNGRPISDGTGDERSLVKGSGNYRITNDADIVDEKFSPTKKADDNIRAIETLKKIQSDFRSASQVTQAEKDILVKYVGWGGIPDIFDERKKNWAKRYKQLKELLSEADYRSAKGSVLNAHFTHPAIIRGMWNAIQKFGFTGGNIVEPSSGIGHFIGTSPQSIHDNSKFTAVEIDNLTGQIGKYLYSDSDYLIQGFEDVPIMDESVDLFISNVPFGDYAITDIDYKEKFKTSRIHNYFFVKAIDKVKQGGIVAFITSKGTMDSLNSEVRQYLNSQAALVGAIRLPNDTFLQNANTSVATDIIFLRKKFDNEKTVNATRVSKDYYTYDKGFKKVKGTPLSEAIAGFEDYDLFYTESENGNFRIYDGVTGKSITLGIKRENFDAVKKQWNEVTGNIRTKLRVMYEKMGDEILYSPRYIKNNEWIKTEKQTFQGKDEPAAVNINTYFVNHPEMVAGKMEIGDGLYSNNELIVTPTSDNLEQQLSEIIDRHLPKGIFQAEKSETTDIYDKLMLENPATKELPDGAFVIIDGVVYRKINEFKEDGKTVQSLRKINVKGTALDRIKGMISINDAARDLIRTENESADDSMMQKEMKSFNKMYDKFVKEFGFLNDRKNINMLKDKEYGEDPNLAFLKALEIYDEDKKTYTKSDIFNKRVSFPVKKIDKADNSLEALTISLNEFGNINLERIAELTGKTTDEAVQDLRGIIFKDPESGEFQTGDEYLSGNVKKKLELAEEKAKNEPEYIDNVDALIKVQPADLVAAEIDVSLGSNWIPVEDYQEFADMIIDRKGVIKIGYSQALNNWKADYPDMYGYGNTSSNNSEWGTERVWGSDLLLMSLNHKTPKVYDTYYEGTEKKRVLNKKDTAVAQEKQQKIKTRFKEWIWENEDRKKRLVDHYNKHFNNLKVRTFDGKHLTLEAANHEVADRLFPHVRDAAFRITQQRDVLLAHVVGAGKTWTMVTAAMELRRLGVAKKPMFVVPNSLVSQFSKEFLLLYPNAKLLTITKDDFKKEKRNIFMSRIATGDWDSIIVSHSTFKMLPVTNATFNQHIEEQLAILEAALIEAQNETDSRNSVKRIVAAIKKLEEKLRSIDRGIKRDKTIYYEDLGVDQLFVDEADLYKNLFFATKITNMPGIANTYSDRAMDLYIKTNYLRSKYGKGIVFATGTPVSNSLAEMFTMQRYLQPQLLKEYGIEHFDNWVHDFGETETKYEVDVLGSGFQVKTRMAKFMNIPELMNVFRLVADIKTAEQLNLPRPKLKGGKPTVVKIKPSPELERYIKVSLSERMEAVKSRDVDPRDDNMLKITNDGRKASIDMRLIDPTMPDDPGSKVNEAVKNMYSIWEKTKKEKSTQLMFLDLSTYKKGQFNLYDEMRNKLVEMGIPKNEIAFHQEFDTDIGKLKLYDAVNAGTIRIVFGSTERMGAGVNIQKRLIALHHLDAAWRPRDIEQREGRILRQGNSNAEVEIFRYITEGSFDAYMWQLLENKARFIGQIMTGDTNIRKAEDIDGRHLSYAEAKALATGNPLVLEKFKVADRLYKLNALRQDHNKLVDKAKHILATYPGRIVNLQDEIKRANKDRKKIPGDVKSIAKHVEDHPLKVQGKDYDKLKEFDAAVADEIKKFFAEVRSEGIERTIGDFLGYDINVRMVKDFWASRSADAQKWAVEVSLKGEDSYPVVDVKQDSASNYEYYSRMFNAVTTRLDHTVEANERLIVESKRELDKSGDLAKKTFDNEAEYNELSVKAIEIDNELGIGEQSEQDIDDSDEAEDSKNIAELGLKNRTHGYNSLSHQDRKSMMELAKDPNRVLSGIKPGEFLVSDRIKAVLQDIGVLSRERGLLKKFAGKFNKISQLIRVNALYDIVAAAHETAHFIDDTYQIVDEIKMNNDKSIINELQDLYLMYYPDAKQGDNKKLQIIEGIATFIHEYFQNPAGMVNAYPELVREFINPNGQYYKKEFTMLLEGLNEIVDDFAQLTPDERVGARIRDGKEVVHRDTGFNWWQKLIYQMQNANEPLERVAEHAGVRNSIHDPSVFGYARGLKNHFMAQWIKGDKMILLDQRGNITELEGSVSSYLKLIEGKEKQFSRYLVMRRVSAEFDQMFKLENELNKLKKEIEKYDKDDPEAKELQFEINQLQRDYDEVESRIRNNDFSLQDAQAVTSEFEDQFTEAAGIYDRVNRALTEFMFKTGLIKPEIAEAFNKKDNYTAFYRFVNDELNTGSLNVSQNSLSKVRSLRKYTGSRLDIIDPVYNQITAITETIGKGLENLTWLKLWELSEKHYQVAQRFENVPTFSVMNEQTGKIEYPQDKDSSLMRVFVDGEKLYFRLAPELKAIKENFRSEEMSLLVKVLTLPSKLFTRMTTSANPIWAMGNLTIDQVTASIQSETGFKPGVSAAKSFVDWLSRDALWKKYNYIGGKRSTFANSMRDKSPADLKQELIGDTFTGKAMKAVDAGLSILEMPSNLSELFTRFAEFRRAKEQGMSDLEALYLANEVSVPFNKRGHWWGHDKLILGSLPYFSATINALAKFGSTAQKHPVRTGTWTAAILVSAFTNAIATMIAGSDDQKRQLSEMPVKELTRAIYIPEPSGQGFIRIRIPEQIGSISGLAYLFVISHYGNNQTSFKEYAEVATSWIPDQFNVSDPVKLLISWTPKMIRPTFETAANVRTYPEIAPIVPQYLMDKAPEMQYTEYTSNVSRFIGKVLKLSPMKVEYWLSNQFGGLGGLIMRTASNYRPSLPIYRWEKDYIMKGRSYRNFYDSYNAVKQQFSRLKESGDSFSVEEKKQIIEQKILYDETNETLSGLRKLLNEKKNLPEHIKEQAYRLMLEFDKNSDNTNLTLRLTDLNKKTRQLLDESNIKTPSRLRFSQDVLNDKVNKQMELMGGKTTNKDLGFESKLNRINDVLIENGIYAYKPSDKERKSNKIDQQRVKRYLGGGYVELESKTGKKYKKWVNGRIQILENSVKNKKLSKKKADELKKKIKGAWKELQEVK